MGTCIELDCTGTAVGQGLCSKHYKQQQRAGSLPAARAGRPTQYPEAVRSLHGGAPRLGLRLEPELYDWVQAQGGSSWVHQLLRRTLDASTGALSNPSPGPSGPGEEAAQFLILLHHAYQLKTGQPHGLLEKLLDLYGIVSKARPKQGLETFTRQVYQLDQQWEVAQRQTGLHFRLHPGATAARKRSNLLVFHPEDRTRELTYYGIEFFSAPPR